MELSVANIWILLRLTVMNPGQAAQFLLRLPILGRNRFAVLLVVSALSAAVLWATYAMFPMTMPDGTELEPVGPLSWAVMVGGGVLITTGLIFVGGRVAGGKAAFSDLILLVSWFQFLQLALYIAQMVLIVLLPPLGALVALASVGLTLWVLANFIKVANGFASVLGPILGIIGAMVLVFLLLLSGA
ncbi:MAG: hypothetical protein CFE34_18480 [Rhodobacteraceae bacterium PARR1]|nr:MAG: hypothetical protein CFE34_18480 [Rhodobacteraceae bacterium PARR1]